MINSNTISKIKVPVIFTGLFCLLFAASLHAQETSQIEILNANTLEFDETTGRKAKRLIGDVRFKHDDALMFCDSAYFYSEENSMDAYGHVKIVQGDSLQLFGDSLNYDGKTQKALLRGNIKLINNDIILTTRFLDYDRASNVAYYYSGGTVVNQEENTTLTSELGYYYSEAKAFYFKNEVVLKHPDYTIEADTLQYGSTSKVVDFLGPTTITSKEDYIYTEDGWYNTTSNVSRLYRNAYLYSDKKIIKGDTLYFERESGYGEIINNGSITDTVQDLALEGNVVHFFQEQDSVMITDRALMKQFFEEDTLYMHADTFKLSTQYQIIDSLNSTDTLRNLFAYNGVKFFKSDMQGKADSLVYNFSDSTINFFNDPVLWSEENQLTGDFIYLQMKNGDIHAIHLEENAFIISKADTLFEHYNQIKGDSMIGYFQEKELRKIQVIDNAETIYYARDEKGDYIGVNKAEGNNMLIFLENNELVSLTFIKDPEAILYPVNEPKPKDLVLNGFDWRIAEKPLSKEEVFLE